MGRTGAEAMASQDISLELALSWHLSSNHYPPVPPSMIQPCMEAIWAANAGDWDAMIDMPDGITYRDGTQAPVHAMVEQHHLDAWIEGEE